MALKIIFTLWNKQTLNFFKTLFFGKYVGLDTWKQIL